MFKFQSLLPILSSQACGDLSATIISTIDDYSLPAIFTLGLEINTEILHRCRHKGAIESVGVSFGRIVAHISSSSHLLPAYQQLDSCLTLLFESITASSYSRRGAGFSFLMLNLIKNDRQPGRPLLQKSLQTIFQQLSSTSSLPLAVHGTFLHYLSVLVNDSSLTQDILPAFNEIITICLEKIESPEWNVRNAALQLFGALIPKVIGQRQHSDTEWEPCQCTLLELQSTMPKIYSFVLFCLEHHRQISGTLLMAVLSFLSSVERRELDRKTTISNEPGMDQIAPPTIDGHLFRLLSHPVEKVRALSAVCFARLQRHGEHAGLVIKLIGALFTVHEPNLQHGMLMTMGHVCDKARLESRRMWAERDRKRIAEVLMKELNCKRKKEVAIKGVDDDVTRIVNETALCDYNRLYLLRFIDNILDYPRVNLKLNDK